MHSGPLSEPRDPRRAYRVVDAFEAELGAYTGAPYAVTVDSCTNAIFLSLVYEREFNRHTREMYVRLPRRTYVGVLQAALNAGYEVLWDDDPWLRDGAGNPVAYTVPPTRIIDSARYLARSMFVEDSLTALSFHAAKQLPLGRGGAILTDDPVAAEWLRAARMDGRPPGTPIEATQFPGWHCSLPPDTAARGLWILSRWVDSGYEPAPLRADPYPDLSTLDFTGGR